MGDGMSEEQPGAAGGADSTIVRELGPADLFSLIELEEQIFGAEAWSEALVLEELNGSDRYYVGIVTDDARQRLLGYAGIRLAIDTDVMTIGVHADARGRGFGGRLLDHLIDHCRMTVLPSNRDPRLADERPHRIERVFLEVRESNEVAQSLYRSRGFREISRIPCYYHQPSEPAVVMTLDLR